ncbi:hypothetical protein [Stratiformator vulcanicus]|uniref:Uncharacterized protein n=1 Tax=Stratiformator vulcanicus TaxID=2527980 RepID=A0A517R5D7_9PLAN|nr:hypothetical protein [Stratiformator vulcanicus]QDT39094.1 hypothetical protein Pan189_34960 [Stratiformator vulcanicus]
MTLRLDGLVACGELDGTRTNSVNGWIKLKGHQTPLSLSLTGACGKYLAGRRIRFEASEFSEPSFNDDYSEIAWQQVGPTGRMEVDRMSDGTVVLFLEWFSQNGRVLLELTNPEIETVPEENESSGPEAVGPAPDSAIEPWSEENNELDESDDPYNLFSDELNRHFEAESRALDHSLGGAEDDSGFTRDLELMEELIENGEGVPIAEIFDPPLKLPQPDGLSDRDIEVALRRLLAAMAEHGIALDICEHFSLRDAYTLLLEELCPHEMTHPELDATRWVQHFSTSDFCDKCDEEFEREFEEFERGRDKDGEEDQD